ncbi:MAG TPA: aminoacyl-tRNA hydrolase [Alphaproteobacteria bacterium]|nr:aminoacyl-tRNA hydrolase [Alphaproteobacteria bacterium]
MLLMVGLGNPGPKYAHNRHNVGWMAVDAIARQFLFSSERKRFQGLCSDGLIAGRKVVLLKPETFMNESGRAVGEAARFFRLSEADVIVFHDELDLAPGKLRVKRGGGTAGHNGLKSIGAHLGRDFRRVRIGIGHPGHKDAVSPYVLGDFSKADRDWLDPMLAAIGKQAEHLVRDEDEAFQNAVAAVMAPLLKSNANNSREIAQNGL